MAKHSRVWNQGVFEKYVKEGRGQGDGPGYTPCIWILRYQRQLRLGGKWGQVIFVATTDSHSFNLQSNTDLEFPAFEVVLLSKQQIAKTHLIPKQKNVSLWTIFITPPIFAVQRQII